MTSPPSQRERLEHARRVRDSATPHDLERFENLQMFCVFVGQSRSGHSVVGTLINAHRHAVVSHNLDALDYLSAGAGREELFLLILERDLWLADRNREIGGYSYDVPGLSLGDHRAIHVIGDKRAGATSRHLASHPEMLRTLAATVKLPVCAIHHVRNPWDNISSIWTAQTLGKERTLAEAIDHYFEMLAGAVGGLAAVQDDVRQIRTFHEDLIGDPKRLLTSVFQALELPLDDQFLNTGAAFVHPEARRTRNDAPWTPDLIEHVADRARSFDFLDRYTFESD